MLQLIRPLTPLGVSGPHWLPSEEKENERQEDSILSQSAPEKDGYDFTFEFTNLQNEESFFGFYLRKQQ